MLNFLLAVMISLHCFTTFAFDGETFHHAREISSCGVPTKLPTGLIFKGQNFTKASWPWLVALLSRKPKSQPDFFCGGTLITRSRVVTGELRFDDSLFKILLG